MGEDIFNFDWNSEAAAQGFDFAWNHDADHDPVVLQQIARPDPFVFDWNAAADDPSAAAPPAQPAVVASPSAASDAGASEAPPGAEPAPKPPAHASPLHVDTTISLQILGLQHIISKATETMGSAMPEWSSWLQQLKSICGLLRRLFTRDLLQATCFAQEPALLQWPLFKSFSAHVVAGRWGVYHRSCIGCSALGDCLVFCLGSQQIQLQQTGSRQQC